MVFKRRDKLPFWQAISAFFVPRKGWRRAFTYVGHRLRRLPDSPHNIAFGVAIGVWVCFTPLFGIHMLVAMLIAMLLRVNVLAAFLGTFFGTPPTFIVIATINYRLGNWMLGIAAEDRQSESILRLFRGAFVDLWLNFKTIFTTETVDWTHLLEFFSTVAWPYTVGGIIPGLVMAFATYVTAKPLIYAYQNRRKGRLLAKFKARRNKSLNRADDQD